MPFEAEWPTRVLIQDLDQDELFASVLCLYPMNDVLRRGEAVVLYSSFDSRRDKVIVEFYTSVQSVARVSSVHMTWDEFVQRRMHPGFGVWGARLRSADGGSSINCFLKNVSDAVVRK
jgi:hypothetical protein